MWLFLLVLLLPAPVSAELGFDPKYERDYNIFNPLNEYRSDNLLNPINAFDPEQNTKGSGVFSLLMVRSSPEGAFP